MLRFLHDTPALAVAYSGYVISMVRVNLQKTKNELERWSHFPAQ